MQQFTDLSETTKRYEVECVLDDVLRSLPRPAPTRVVSERLAPLLSHWQAAPDEVAGTLMKLAHKGHTHARKGEPFKRYGRTMYHWVWLPMDAPAGAPVQPVERTPTSTEVRPEAWKAGGDASPVAPKEPTAVELLEAEYEAWCVAEGLERDGDHMWPEGAMARFLALRKEKAQSWVETPEWDT